MYVCCYRQVHLPALRLSVRHSSLRVSQVRGDPAPLFGGRGVFLTEIIFLVHTLILPVFVLCDSIGTCGWFAASGARARVWATREKRSTSSLTREQCRENSSKVLYTIACYYRVSLLYNTISIIPFFQVSQHTTCCRIPFIRRPLRSLGEDTIYIAGITVCIGLIKAIFINQGNSLSKTRLWGVCRMWRSV